MIELGIKAKAASQKLALLSEDEKNTLLKAIGQGLLRDASLILEANAKDLVNAKEQGLSEAMIDRLALDDQRIQGIVDGLIQISKLDDPIGKVLDRNTLENGLEVTKITVPLGVVGIIYESRPNVTIDAFGLCFKSGNAVILKGGKEAIETNKAIETSIRNDLRAMEMDPNVIQLVKSTQRAATHEMLTLREYIDVIIPRGSAGLIETVVKQSTIPVIETGAGNCHIYVDEAYDVDMALDIIENAKTQRFGVCNTMESLVLHKSVVSDFLPKLIDRMPSLEFRGDREACATDSRVLEASSQDFYQEYLDGIMSVKVVNTLDEAIAHINEHNTKHSEAIITQNDAHAARFQMEVDAAVVYVNASTRFTDGFVFGMGAEIGISTQKLHARGPMGLDALTSYKYTVKGAGQIRK